MSPQLPPAPREMLAALDRETQGALSPNARAAPEWSAAVRSPHWPARVAAAERLGRLDDGVCLALAALLFDPVWPVRRAALAALERLALGRPAPPGPAPGAGTDLARVQRAEHALRAAGFSPLRAALALQRGEERLATIEALGRSGDLEAVPPLVELLPAPDPEVRRCASAALLALGVPLLVLPLQRGVERLPTIEALERSGDLEAVAPLVEVLIDPDAEARCAAAKALAELDWPDALPALKARLAGFGGGPEKDPGVRAALKDAVRRITESKRPRNVPRPHQRSPQDHLPIPSKGAAPETAALPIAGSSPVPEE